SHMQVSIEFQNGEKLKFNVQPSHKILDIKEMIFKKTNINVKDQSLKFAGNEMINQKTLSDYSIIDSTEEFTLHLETKLDLM
uniref:NAD(P)(+)--arginine ADP-ribosyltransferase n=1 Tax=Tetrahymena thermophila (strain SB210) TaxID=312017 RepID=UPI000D097F40|nr:Chain A, NAD(P)(+)--arginine ADP-ribosyltransferase [Tetrahymena thermophila SB210]